MEFGTENGLRLSKQVAVEGAISIGVIIISYDLDFKVDFV